MKTKTADIAIWLIAMLVAARLAWMADGYGTPLHFTFAIGLAFLTASQRGMETIQRAFDAARNTTAAAAPAKTGDGI